MATMHFGEFLKANLIEGLEDGYLDYGMLVACVEQRSGRHSIDDDNLKIGTTAMPLGTSSSFCTSQRRRNCGVLSGGADASERGAIDGMS